MSCRGWLSPACLATKHFHDDAPLVPSVCLQQAWFINCCVMCMTTEPTLHAARWCCPVAYNQSVSLHRQRACPMWPTLQTNSSHQARHPRCCFIRVTPCVVITSPLSMPTSGDTGCTMYSRWLRHLHDVQERLLVVLQTAQSMAGLHAEGILHRV